MYILEGFFFLLTDFYANWPSHLFPVTSDLTCLESCINYDRKAVSVSLASDKIVGCIHLAKI